MAGIGFNLRRLYKKNGILNLCRAYGYTGVITVGPMLLGILLLVGMACAARIGGMPTQERELLNCMITYTLLGSLTVTGWFNMGVTRCISDMLYEGKKERIMPCFYGCVTVMLVIGILFYSIFLCFSGAGLRLSLLSLWLMSALIIVWTETIFLTALEDYSAIVLSFAISLILGFILACAFILLERCTIETMLLSVVTAYGFMAVMNLRLLLKYFPRREGTNYLFLEWIGRYRSLVLAGGFLNTGLYAHLVLMYFGPLHVKVKGLYYGAPMYDVSAIFAFLSILVTTVSFVVSVEVSFYPKYSNYYGLFNDRGSIRDIENAEKDMLSVLQRELTYVGIKQLFMTILFVVAGSWLLERLPLGMTALSLSIFRFLCIGYAAYALANTTMLILLYFEDYTGALVGCVLFAALSFGCTLWQILRGNCEYFGIGFFMGGIAFLIFSVLRLEWYSRKLPYYLLSRQSVIPQSGKDILVRIASKLEERYARKHM